MIDKLLIESQFTKDELEQINKDIINNNDNDYFFLNS